MSAFELKADMAALPAIGCGNLFPRRTLKLTGAAGGTLMRTIDRRGFIKGAAGLTLAGGFLPALAEDDQAGSFHRAARGGRRPRFCRTSMQRDAVAQSRSTGLCREPH